MNFKALGLLGEAASAYNSGRYTGHLVTLFIVLLGAYKCWQISARPTTNRKCVFALMFLLVAMVGFSILRLLSYFIPASDGFSLFVAIAGLLPFGLIVTAAVLATMGLVEYAKEKGKYQQGRAQAIGALVISLLLLIIIPSGFVSARQKNSIVRKSNPPGKILSFDNLNFRFRTPERPWVSINVSKVTKNSTVAFMRQKPEVYFMIIAERLGSDKVISAQQVKDLAKAKIEAAATSSRTLEDSGLTLQGLDGVLLTQNAQIDQKAHHYTRWILATNGFVYQLLGYGPQKEQQLIDKEFRQLITRFELIDPHRLAEATIETKKNMRAD